MNKIYIYLHHDGFTVYISDHKRSYEETYCPSCDECDLLIAECYNDEEVSTMLKILLRNYDLYAIDHGDYDELIVKYGLEDILNGETET